MQSGMIGFIIGSFATGLAAYYFATIIIKARVDEMISAKTHNKIKKLEFDNCFLEKKLKLKTIQYNRLENNVNEVLSGDRRNIKDIIKKLDGR